MKKNIILMLLAGILVVVLGLNWKNYQRQEENWSGGVGIFEAVNLEEKYWGAFRQCIQILETDPKLKEQGVYIMEVSVELLAESQKANVELLGEVSREEFEENETDYWAFTVGETLNQCVLVCDSETNEVVGVLRERS